MMSEDSAEMRNAAIKAATMTDTSDHTRMCERLRANEAPPIGSHRGYLRNPDGPEAATLIETQAQQIVKMEEVHQQALEALGGVMAEYRHIMGDETPEIRDAYEAIRALSNA